MHAAIMKKKEMKMLLLAAAKKILRNFMMQVRFTPAMAVRRRARRMTIFCRLTPPLPETSQLVLRTGLARPRVAARRQEEQQAKGRAPQPSCRLSASPILSWPIVTVMKI